MIREPLIYSYMAATVAWRDEMQGATRMAQVVAETAPVGCDFVVMVGTNR